MACCSTAASQGNQVHTMEAQRGATRLPCFFCADFWPHAGEETPRSVTHECPKCEGSGILPVSNRKRAYFPSYCLISASSNAMSVSPMFVVDLAVTTDDKRYRQAENAAILIRQFRVADRHRIVDPKLLHKTRHRLVARRPWRGQSPAALAVRIAFAMQQMLESPSGKAHTTSPRSREERLSLVIGKAQRLAIESLSVKSGAAFSSSIRRDFSPVPPATLCRRTPNRYQSADEHKSA